MKKNYQQGKDLLTFFVTIFVEIQKISLLPIFIINCLNICLILFLDYIFSLKYTPYSESIFCVILFTDSLWRSWCLWTMVEVVTGFYNMHLGMVSYFSDRLHICWFGMISLIVTLYMAPYCNWWRIIHTISFNLSTKIIWTSECFS